LPFDPKFLERELPQGSELFPKDCVWTKTRPNSETAPFAEETALMSDAALSVRQLFAAGRYAAHGALDYLDQAHVVPRQAILRSPSRAPLWPNAVVGSIAHTKGLAVAAVGWSKDYIGLGIDVEKIERQVSLALVPKVTLKEEATWVQAPLLDLQLEPAAETTRPDNQVETNARASFRLLRLLSAKEAIFKTFYPLNEVYLGFCDAQLYPEPEGFRGKLLKSAGAEAPVGTGFRVLQTVEDGYLLSSCSFRRLC
jgi:4'-phosphopantetheinyl transferase EntD